MWGGHEAILAVQFGEVYQVETTKHVPHVRLTRVILQSGAGSAATWQQESDEILETVPEEHAKGLHRMARSDLPVKSDDCNVWLAGMTVDTRDWQRFPDFLAKYEG